MIPEEEQYFRGMEQALQEERMHTADVARGATTVFQGEDNQNLVRYQLDVSEELERIEHLLKKHILKKDEEGNEYWDDANEEDRLFNDWGVQEIINWLHWYLNKNIILSNFDIDEVKLRMNQFAYELADFIYCNYEKMGLNDSDKIKHYPMVAINIVNTIEAAYMRALSGGERRSLREARTVTQTEPLGNFNPMMNLPMVKPKRRFKLFRPSTWGG